MNPVPVGVTRNSEMPRRCSGGDDDVGMTIDHPRLIRRASIDLPVIEASGLATKMVDGMLQVIVVGDRTANVCVGTYSPDAGITEWRIIDLSEVEGWSPPPDDSQLEAVAVDGGSLVAIMREDPPVVLVADTERSRVVARITLTVPDGTPLGDRWDDPSSRGEGFVMLRGGRLLVAKEKRPRALIEFCPPGTPARGISRDDLLDDGEEWEAPADDVEFVAAAVWRLKGRAKKTFHDISDMAAGRDKTLWLLSDRSRVLGRLTLDEPLPAVGGTIRSVDAAWRLPAGTIKPEGVVALDGRRALIAMDTDTTSNNGMIVELPSSESESGSPDTR